MTRKINNIWAWLQAKGRILKVVSDPNKGTIKVYDENGKILMKKTNLTKEQVEMVEDSFLSYAAKKLNSIDMKHQREKFDPMIA